MADATQLSAAKRALLERRTRGDRLQPGAHADRIPRRDPGCVAPLSFGQQGLWFLDQLAPGSAVYNVPCTVRVRATLDPLLLQRSVNAVVQRHEALRTTCNVVDGLPTQAIAASLTVPLPVVDLSDTPLAAREAEARRLATEEAGRAFNLTEGPLLRATLLRLAPEDHLLLLTMHHIVVDGWSVGVFLRELTELYEAFSRGASSPLPDAPLQFADYALWERRRLQGPPLDDQLAYWRRQLEGAPQALQLHTDHPRRPVHTFKGALHTRVLPHTLSAELKELSNREGVTLFMTLLAAFQTLLYRYTGQDDLLVGSPIAGRMSPESEQLIGFLANTLALRADMRGDPAFREFLGRVRDVTIGAYAHQDLPFEKLVETLAPDREPNRSPLVQVVLTLEPPLPPLPTAWSLEDGHVANGTSKFDLTLEIEDRSEGLICHWEYSTDLFEASTIERAASHWQTILEGIVIDPSRHLSELPLLTQAERRRALAEMSSVESSYSADRCLHELFDDQARHTPDAVAVSCGAEQMTYRELNLAANRLARHLAQRGVGPNVSVALYLERSLAMVVTILATLKAGASYVPLDPAYPTERLTFMLEDSQAPVLLTQQELWDRALKLKSAAQVVLVDRDSPQVTEETASDFSGGATADNLAYVIYTSGSTGKPKGVQITHRNVTRLFSATDDWYHFDANDVWTLFHSYAFDFSVWELWGALLYGGRLVVVPYSVSRSPSAFHDLLYREQVTVLNQTPSAFRQLIAADEQSGRARALALRLVIFGGEMLDLEGLRPWFARHGDQHPRLVNMYGITETTVHVTYRLLVAADLDEAPGSVIGRPIPDLQVYVLDQHLEPVPIGVPGELYVGGAGLARGYLNRPELTAARFIRHPFIDESGRRLYRSGDVARVLADGSFEYLGRIDDQVKIRGFRIELGEVQATLSQHPAVQEAVVIAREDTPGDKRLVAYLVMRPGHAPSNTELRAYVKERLPEYMSPSAFVALRALPLTTNGKVDRRALPAPSAIRQLGEEPPAPPMLPVHRQLIQIWEELLDVRPIGIQDDFFDLGGHSLLAARMVDQIGSAFGKRIPISTLFTGATIEHLARLLVDNDERAPRATVARGRATATHRPFFFLHGDYRGDPIWCLNVMRDLGPDLPFHPIMPKELDTPVPPTLEAFAAAHLSELRAVQPDGPYQLGGWCGGALVAYEMALQLVAQGQAVDLLVLMETGVASPLERRVRNLVEHVGGLVRLGEDKQLDWFMRSLSVSNYTARALSSAAYRVQDRSVGYLARQGIAEMRKAILLARRARAKPMSMRARSLQGAVGRPRDDYLDIFTWIAANYRPRSYPGKLTLFWTQEEPADTPNRRMGWRMASTAAAVDVHIVPGAHMTCRTLHVHELAEHLRACLLAAPAPDDARPTMGRNGGGEGGVADLVASQQARRNAARSSTLQLDPSLS